jgi:hypothetical protein
MPFLRQSKSYQTMFSILPLQLATNIFLAESSEDLDVYYGFDTLASRSPAVQPPSAAALSYMLPPEVTGHGNAEVVELKVTEERGRFTVPDPPLDVKRIVIFKDAIGAIQCGDVAIVSPANGERPMAFFMPEGEIPADDGEFETVLDLLRQK